MDDNLNEMMAGNAVGQSGGFGSKSDAAGPVAGYDKKLKKPTILARGLMPGARKRWSMKEETVDEGIRLKSWGEFRQGAEAAGERLNRHILQPAGKAIQGLKNLITPKPAARPAATGGPDGVGTKDDNKKAVKLSVGNDPGLNKINRSAQQDTKRKYPDWWKEKGPSGTAWYGNPQFRKDLTK